jgi:hypothetical protein
MNTKYPYVSNTPRNINAIGDMSIEEQVKLLKELRTLCTKGLGTERSFRVKSDQERAEMLLRYLVDLDRATAYRVHGIATPIRSTNALKNRKAWYDFAVELENALSDFNQDEYRQVSTQYLDGGVLIIGFKPPVESADPFVSVPHVHVVPTMAILKGPGEVHEVLARLLAKLADMGPRADRKQMEELICSAFMGKPVDFLQLAIDKTKVAAEDMEKNPNVPKPVLLHVMPLLQCIVATLQERVALQLC